MFIDIEHEDGKRSPYAALIVCIGAVDPEPAFSSVPCQDGPTSSRHRTLGKILDECFHRSVAGSEGIAQLACIFQLTVTAEDLKVPFMKVDAVNRVGFTILQAPQLTVSCITFLNSAGDNRPSQLFKTVFDFVLLCHISGIELVVMVFQRPVGDPV